MSKYIKRKDENFHRYAVIGEKDRERDREEEREREREVIKGFCEKITNLARHN